MTDEEKRAEIREGIAKKVHINERIWAKIYKTEDPHNCKWEELSEYHQELYLAGVDFILEYLDSKDCAIKVERELPADGRGSLVDWSYEYVATIPLIGGE